MSTKTQKNTHKVTDLIIEEIESGKFYEYVKPWIPVPVIPRNWNNKRYNPLNNLMLSISQRDQDFNSCNWITEGKGKSLKGILKPDAKPTEIYTWIRNFIVIEDGKKQWRDSVPKSQKNARPVFVFKEMYLYNVDQFIWDKFPIEFDHSVFENPEVESSKVVDVIEKAINPYLEHERISVTWDGPRAYYSPQSDSITMPVKSTFKSPEGYATVFAHEVIHSTGHKCRLNRFTTENYTKSIEEYSLEELVAELGSAIMLHDLGIKHEENYKSSVEYIRGWLRPLKDNRRMLADADARAKKGLRRIKAPIERQKKKEKKDVKQILRETFRRGRNA